MLLLAPFVMEGVARWILGRQGYYVWKPGTRMRLHLDREALADLPPEVRLLINRAGERGDDPPPAAADPSVYRILLLGGSAAECYFLDQDASWPGRVQTRLRQPENLALLGKRTVHLGNIARSGVGATEGIARILEKIADRCPRLDLILIMGGAADLVNWMRLGTPVPLPDELNTDLLFLQHPEHRFGWHPRKCALAELARRLEARFSKKEAVRHNVGKKLTEVRAMRARATTIKDATPDPAPMVERYEVWLRRAIRQARVMADRVIYLRQPWFGKDHTKEEKARFWNCGEGYPYSEEVKTYFSMDLTARLMDTLSQVGARTCDEEGVEHVDFMPHLDRSLRTYYDFFHFTAEGADDVATVVLDAILVQNAPATTGNEGASPSTRRR
jgi:lysophospholipase L1-like esterase